MSNVVTLEKKYHPLILRVVIDQSIVYHSAIIECVKTPTTFSLEDVVHMFSVNTETDWFRECLGTFAEARADLSRKKKEFSAKGYTIDAYGFFVTVRPKYGEVETTKL